MDSLFVEYDNVLVGRQDEVDSSNFYGSNPGGANEMRALSCIRYCIEKVLMWDEDLAVRKFDNYIINLMKLNKIASYIDYPCEVPQNDPKYILHLLYPRKVRMNEQQLVEDTYKRILSANENDTTIQFPRDYFSGDGGFKRYCYCVKYLLEEYHPFTNISDMYEFFLSKKGRDFLSKYRLRTPGYQLSLDIMDVLRYITKDYEDSELYYAYYSFKKQYDSIVAKRENSN